MFFELSHYFSYLSHLNMPSRNTLNRIFHPTLAYNRYGGLHANGVNQMSGLSSSQFSNQNFQQFPSQNSQQFSNQSPLGYGQNSMSSFNSGRYANPSSVQNSYQQSALISQYNGQRSGMVQNNMMQLPIYPGLNQATTTKKITTTTTTTTTKKTTTTTTTTTTTHAIQPLYQNQLMSNMPVPKAYPDSKTGTLAGMNPMMNQYDMYLAFMTGNTGYAGMQNMGQQNMGQHNFGQQNMAMNTGMGINQNNMAMTQNNMGYNNGYSGYNIPPRQNAQVANRPVYNQRAPGINQRSYPLASKAPARKPASNANLIGKN